MELLLEQFMPHGACFFWRRAVLLPLVVGNMTTWACYYLIPVELLRLLRPLRLQVDLREFSVLTGIAFAAFIFFCGTGHAIDTLNIWGGYYAAEAYFDCATGLVSLLSWIQLRRDRIRVLGML